MTLKTLLIIIIVLIIGILILKAIRKLLSLALMIVILYFFYFTLFTYPGAVKFALFRKTFSLDSYKLDVSSYNEEKKYPLNPPLKVGKYKITEIECNKYAITIICNAKVEDTE